MKSLIKLIILPSIAGVIFFTVLNVKAASIQDARPLIHQQNHNFIFFTLPQLGEGVSNKSYSSTLISAISEQPARVVHTKVSASTKHCQSKKTNEVYELTAIFNDKLQVFLSYFSSPKNENYLEKIEDKESIKVTYVKSF